MPTQKDRISTYVTEDQKKCFRIIASLNNLTESKMLEKLVLECISDNSEMLQKILPTSYVLHKNIWPFGEDAYLTRFSPFSPFVFRLPSLFFTVVCQP